MTKGKGCTTSGSCFQSLNYPNDYGYGETCSITVLSVLSGESLNSIVFDTQLNYDKLIVKGVEYSGTSGPSDIAVSVNDVFTWSSDGGGSGFQVCLGIECTKGANGETCDNGKVAVGLYTGSDVSTCSCKFVCTTGANGQPCGSNGMAVGLFTGTDTSSCTCTCLNSFVGENCEKLPP